MCHGKLREISRNSPFSVKFHGVFREISRKTPWHILRLFQGFLRLFQGFFRPKIILTLLYQHSICCFHPISLPHRLFGSKNALKRHKIAQSMFFLQPCQAQKRLCPRELGLKKILWLQGSIQVCLSVCLSFCLSVFVCLSRVKELPYQPKSDLLISICEIYIKRYFCYVQRPFHINICNFSLILDKILDPSRYQTNIGLVGQL